MESDQTMNSAESSPVTREDVANVRTFLLKLQDDIVNALQAVDGGTFIRD